MYADLAQCYYMMNHPDKAISILDRAISCAEQIGDAILIGRNYLHLALAYTRMNNAALAMAAVKKAEPFCDSSGDPELSAYFAAATQGIAELSIKGMAPATLSESAANTEIGTTGQAGMIQWLRVQIEKADREQSATTAEPLAQLYIHLGVELDRAGQFGESRQAFLEAMRVVRRWELKKLQGAVLQDYGVMLARSGRMESARRIFQAALARKDEFADGADRLTSLSSLAQASQELHRSLDYFSLASQIEREAAQIAASQQATLLVQAAGLYEDSDHLPEARLAISRAIEVLRAETPGDELITALNTAARIALKGGDLGQAEELGREALHAHETQRPYVRDEFQPEWAKYGLPPMLTLVETLFCSGDTRAAEALQVLEDAKVRSMLRRYGRWQSQHPTDFPDDLRQEEDSILRDVRLHDYLSEMNNSIFQSVAQGIEEKTYKRAQTFWDALPVQWQEYGALRQGKPVDPLGLVRSIPIEESAHFIVLLPTETQTLIWHITPDGSVASWRSIPVGHYVYRALAAGAMSAVAKRQPLGSPWPGFCRALTSPWLHDVPEGATVCFVPSRSMMELPFALLRPGDDYLVERNPVACLPSLSLLAYWREGEHAPGIDRPLVLGDSRGDLPGARKEAQNVARRLGTEPILGEDVVRSNINIRLGDCDLLQ